MAPLNLPPPALTLQEALDLEQVFLSSSVAKSTFVGKDLELALKSKPDYAKHGLSAVGEALLEHRIMHNVTDEDGFAANKEYRLISQESDAVKSVHASQSKLMEGALFQGKILWKTSRFFGFLTHFVPVYGILTKEKITLLKCKSAATQPLAEFSVPDILQQKECIDCKADWYCFELVTKHGDHIVLCADHSKRQEGWMTQLESLGVPFIKTSDLDSGDLQKINSLHELSARRLNSKDVVDFSDYKGQVCLVVNVSSLCGLTPQYAELETLYEKYKDRGFRILGFPVNQFNNQEPGSESEIADFAKSKYNVTFDMFEKTKCNGGDAHPVFRFVKGRLGGVLGSSVKWNFTKFLVDRDGVPVQRFAPTTKPLSFENEIVALLDAK